MNYHQIASLSATITRIISFHEAMDEISEQQTQTLGSIEIRTEGNEIRLENISLATPKGDLLFNNLNFSIKKGERVLLMGPSGAGKSTLLRALSGFWPHGSGNVYLPCTKGLVVPQRSYLPIDTLVKCLEYPNFNLTSQSNKNTNLDSNSSSNMNSNMNVNMNSNPIPYSNLDEEIYKVLKATRLEHLYKHREEIRDWGITLSLGEQQRIIFARILLQKPDWVILDEPTASIDKETEALVYTALYQYLPEITLVTIGHSPTLKQYHAVCIDLETQKPLMHHDALAEEPIMA